MPAEPTAAIGARPGEAAASSRDLVQRLQDQLVVRSPQMATLKPLPVMAWGVGASVVAASLPHVIPAAASRPPSTLAIMTSAFVGCLLMATWWLFAQSRERQSTPRWFCLGWASSPSAAAGVLAVIFAPTYVAGYACDDVVRGLRAPSDVREDIARVEATGCPLDRSALMTTDEPFYRFAEAMCWEYVGGGPLASCMPARPPGATMVETYGVDLDRAALRGAAAAGRQCQILRTAPALQASYEPAVERLKALARVHELSKSLHEKRFVPDVAPSKAPNLRATFCATLVLFALLASLAGIVSPWRLVLTAGALASIVVAVQERMDAGPWGSVSIRSTHTVALVWEATSWLVYCLLFAGVAWSVLRGRRARTGTMDSMMVALSLFPLFILGVHWAIARHDFVLVPGQIPPTDPAYTGSYPPLAGHGYAYAVMLGTLVAHTLFFPLWSRYRRLPDAW